METVAYYNGKISEIDDMMIPMTDRGFTFGDGVYDATMARNQKIFALDEHLDRFWRSMAAVLITPYFTREELTNILNDLLTNVTGEAYMIYWQVTRGTGRRSHSFPLDATPNLAVMITPMSLDRGKQERPYRLRTELDIRSGLTHVKTINLLPNVLAAQRAMQESVDETVFYRMTENGDTRVTEGSKTNVHMIKAGKLITAPTDKLILPGIARQHLLQVARSLGMPVEERAFTVAELKTADEVFITSSTMMAGRVVSIDGESVGQRDEAHFIPLRTKLVDEWYAETE
ncbi:aminotransferase class IV [Weissella cibaria]|uniref:aminotransferase class IV n=1 Tax=Weissella cibaria TaxID=137591 RepID=UPI0021AF2322|nr:aminotransferase class IV [Weissella cibaria]MCT0001348.1 aminotransferase class IV [Weissella cibaria]